MKATKLFFNILLIVCVLLAIYIGVLYFKGRYGKNGIIVLDQVDTADQIAIVCNNLSLPETAICFNRNIRTFYNYNLSNVGIDLTFEELKLQGGVCSHYSSLYKTLAERVGYEGEIVNFYPKNKDSGHSFAVLFDKDYYCLVDQISEVSCFKFK